MPHRQHHLHHPGHTRRRLGVPDVRLDRAEPQRPVGGPVLAVRGDEGLRLDRVAEGGAGAVRLDGVHLLGGESGVREGLPDHPLLGGAVGGGEAVGGAVLVDGAAAQHGEDRVAVAAGVGEPLEHQQADALAPAGAVRGSGERLAPAVGGEAALAGEADEDAGGGHHGGAAGQGQVALPRLQGLRGQVHRDQRRRAGRVDGDGRAVQPEGVRQPAGDDAGGGAGGEVVLVDVPGGHQQRAVVLAVGADVHAGAAAAQSGRVDPGPLERLPGGLQQQPLLRVHGEGLAGADAEERRVELAGTGDEAALPDVAGTEVLGVGVVQLGEVPAALAGHQAQRVGAGGQQVPELLGRGDPAGEAAAHRDDGDRFAVTAGAVGDHLAGGVPGGEAVQVGGEFGDRGVVEDQRGGQGHTGLGGQPVAQLDGGERVEAEVTEGALGQRPPGRVAEHDGGLGAYEVGELRQGPADHHGADGTGGHGGHPGQGGDQWRGPAPGGGEASPVDGGDSDRRLGGVDQPAEGGDGLGGGERVDPAPGEPGGQGGGHAVLSPGAPGDGGGGQALVASPGRERVEIGVGRRVVALPGAADDAGEGGEEHERVEVAVGGGLVQNPGGADLAVEDGLHPGQVEPVEDAVVDHAGGVHDGGQLRQPGDQSLDGGPVGDVTPHHPHRTQLGHQLRHTRRPRTPPRRQHHLTGPVRQQPTRHMPTQRTRTTGHQHRPGRPPTHTHRRHGRHQPPAEDALGADRHLVVPGVGEDGEQRVGRGAVGAGGQVDQAAPAVRLFEGDDPAQAPGQGGPRVGEGLAGPGAHGAPGETPEPAGQARVGERLGEGEQQRGADGDGRGVRQRPVGRGQHAEHAGPALLAVAAQQPGQLGAIDARGDGQGVDVGAGTGQRAGHPGVVVVGGDDEPAAGQRRNGGGAYGLPLDPVGPAVHHGVALPGPPPRRQHRYGRGERLHCRGIVLHGQVGGDPGQVATLHGRPEVPLGGVTRHGRHGGAADLGPVALVLEGVRGQVHPPRAGVGEPPPPVDRHPVHVQLGQPGQQPVRLRPVLALRRHGQHAGPVRQGVGDHRGQDAARADLQERVRPGGAQRGDPVGEADGLADVAHPVVGRADLVGVGQGTRHVRHDRQRRRGEGELVEHRAEPGEHRLHQRTVERVTDGEAADAYAPLTPDPLHLVEGVDGTGDHDGLRTVDRRDPHAGQPVQRGRHVGLGGRDGQHPTPGGQRLHQPAPRRHQRAGVLQRQHPGHVRGRDLADRMTADQVGGDAEGLHQPEQRHLDREQTGLREHRLVQQVGVGRALGGEEHLAQGARQGPVQVPAHLVQRGGEHGELGVQLPAHAGALRALTGEEHRELAARRPGTGHDGTGRFPGGERAQPREQVVAAGRGQHGPTVQGGAGGHRREGHVERAQGVVGGEPGGPAAGLRGERGVGAGGEQHGGHRAGRRPPRLGLGLGGSRGLLDDGVRVGAGDAERRHGGPARPVHGRPRRGGGGEGDGPGGPVDLRRRLVDVQGGRHDAVPHRHHHLDHTGHAGGCLGVPDVRLHRPEQQRRGLVAVLPVRGQQRLRLDRVAEPGARAVRLHHVDLLGSEPGVAEGLADDPHLGGAVRGAEPVGRAVLVDRATAYHGEHRVAVPLRLGEPGEQQHADALGPRGAVRAGGERLAPPVGGETALPAEADEDRRGGHHRHAARQGQLAVAVAQGLRGQVDGDERGRAGGVDGDRRPLQPEGVRDAAGDDTGGVAGEQVALAVLGLRHHAVVAVRRRPDEDAGTAAPDGRQRQPGPLERLPGGLQQQPLLRVHGDGLAGRDAEQVGVEVGGGVDEAALAHVTGARVVGIGVEEILQVPAPVGGERPDPVAAVVHELPQRLGAVDAARVAAAHRHDGDGLGVPALQLAQPTPGTPQLRGRTLQVLDVPLVLVAHRGPTSLGMPMSLRLVVTTSPARGRSGRRCSRRWPTPGRRRRPRPPAARSAGPAGRAAGR